MLAKAEVAAGTWPELFQFLSGSSQSPDAGHREVAVILLHASSHTIAPQMQMHGQALVEIFLRGLQDTVPAIRVQTLRAVGSFLNEVEGDVSLALLARVLPPMMQVIQESFAAGNDEVLMSVFEVLSDIVEMPTKGKADQLTEILRFMFQIARADECPLKYRQKACELIGECCAFKPKFMQKRGLVEPACQVALALLCDPRCESVQMEPDDDGVGSQVAIGSSLLDTAACGLPSGVVGAPLLDWIRTAVVESSQQVTPFQKRGAVLALGVLSFGCRDLLRENIDFVIAVTRLCISDPAHGVREAACHAAGHFADYLQPEILEHHSVLLPLGLELLQDAAAHVREKAAYMVDVFAENLEEDILPYTPQLMQRLAAIIAAPGSPETLKAKEVCVSAVSSVAKALGGQFRPFAADTLAMLRPLMDLKEDATLLIRARATEAVGIVANACGREVFDSYSAEVFQLVMQGLQLDYAELTEYTFGFWANMAELYKAEWVPHMQTLMPMLFAAFDTKDSEVTSHNPFGAVGSAAVDEESSGEDSEDPMDGQLYRARVHHNTRQANVKSSAMHCMGIFAKIAGAGFAPWLDAVGKRALDNTNHYDTMVRKSVFEVLGHLVVARAKASPQAVPRTVGFPSNDTLDEATRQAVNFTLMSVLNAMRQDDDKEVVAVACDAVGEICQNLGSVAVHNHIDALLQETINMLNCQVICQQTDADDDSEGDDLPADHDQQLIDGVFDMIDKIAACYGPGFMNMFDQLWPHLKRYLHPSRPESDHYMAIATLGECCAAMGETIAGRVDEFAALAIRGLSSKSAGVRSNSAYTTGVICAGGGAAAAKHFPEALKGLHAIITRPKEGASGVDNAVSAVFRIIRAGLDPAVVAQVLPQLLPHVPLQTDWSENNNVYGTLRWLLELLPAEQIGAAGPPLLAAVLRGSAHQHTQPEIKAAAGGLVAALFGGPHAVHWRAAASQLPAELQPVLGAHVGPL
eukprot:TRINITY_DN22040_c0_g1_i1.p1 TRINITY_DN22040_c0_g1~~TRINITY_DN22040_c0_g1_i1.p1  ORF type:complete len:1109 (+),score=302.51 TRINITY_DN22040_c0_g1_i1:398-3328(+)